MATEVSTQYGLTGFPAQSYDPICAVACIRCLYTMNLDCSTGGQSVGMVTFSTQTECYAENTAYLTSVAYCASVHCESFKPAAAQLEYMWEMMITGQKSASLRAVPAKWTYAEALAQVKTTPTVQLTMGDTKLNETSLVSEHLWLAQYNVLYSTQREGYYTNAYGRILTGLKPYLVWPSSVGSYHVRSLPFLIGKAPTIGQAIYVAVFLLLNIVFTAVSYKSRQPNAWNPTIHSEIMSYVLGRTGIFAYIYMPLVFLFAGRNNFLLWVTNWSHSTYLVLHRWVARVFALQAILHSLVALAKYQQTGMYSMEVSKPYWIWGIVATLSVVILTFGSGLYIRNNHYEVFLLTHIVLSVILVVGCWYHAYDLYALLGGYGYWIYAVGAVWAFDRVARALRIWITGTRRSIVTTIDDANGYLRIDIPDIRWSNRPGMHAYLYFPTVSRWTPWECHPFSVMPTVMLHPASGKGISAMAELEHSILRTDSLEGESSEDAEKGGAIARRPAPVRIERFNPGLSFFVRRNAGFTKSLAAHQNLLTLIEGPYPNNSSSQVLGCDRLLLIAGGIGITSIVPYIANHANVKLCWSVRESARCLVEELDGVPQTIQDKDVRVGSRLDIAACLAREADVGWLKIGVVISGPPGLCDDARAAVLEEAKRRKGVQFELDVEAYSW